MNTHGVHYGLRGVCRKVALLSYRRETALQGASVLAKSVRRYSADNIGLSSDKCKPALNST